MLGFDHRIASLLFIFQSPSTVCFLPFYIMPLMKPVRDTMLPIHVFKTSFTMVVNISLTFHQTTMSVPDLRVPLRTDTNH